MKRIIKYLIFVALFATFIIKFTHFNWVLPTIIVAILGLIVLGLLKVNDKLNEIQNKDYRNYNIYLDEDFDDCSDLMDIEVPEIEPIEYYENTKTPKAVVDWYRSGDEFMHGKSKIINVNQPAPHDFYLVSFGDVKYYTYYDPEIEKYRISRYHQEAEMSFFKEVDIGGHRYFFTYDEETNTLFV